MFAALAAFVAVDTLLYTGLAIADILPKVYLGDWLHRRDRRSQTRSIHPEAHAVLRVSRRTAPRRRW